MTEILTESFCERCGTRYTFESAKPRVRLKGVKVLSRGLKNFVLSDDTSIDEAMAAARSESDRETSAHQLDAFHKTFNFCMSCRQYTCPNCWNEAEARCFSCAPLALAEIAPAIDDLRELHETVLIGESAPGNGAALFEPVVEADAEFVVAGEAPAETVGEFDAAPSAAGIESLDADLIDIRERLEALAGDVAPVSPAEIAAGDAQLGDAGDEADAADKAVSQTLGLLQRFRPGQNLDAELDAFERGRGEPESTEPAPETVAATDDLAALQADRIAAGAAQPDEPDVTEAAAPDELPTPIADAVEPEAVTAQPEPASEQSALPSIAAAAASDVVEQPTWRITALDPTAQPPGPPAADQGKSVPLEASGAPARSGSGEPHWPAVPEWPSANAGAGLPFLGRPATPQGGIDALWAASNQELVTAPPVPGKAAGGIQPCISCGLSLSATARFCRRCGTLQNR